MEPGVMNKKEAMAYLQVSIATLNRQDIPRIKIGSRVLYRKAAIDSWLENKEKAKEKE